MNIHFLWIGENLPELAKESIKSFLDKDYSCILWSYSSFDDIEGIINKDASEIISEIQDIDLRHFADYFRLKVLYKYGGWWSDLDNICIEKLPDEEYCFATNGINVINNNIIKSPKNAEWLKEAIQLADNMDWVNKKVGSLNYKFIKNLIDKYNLNKYIQPYFKFNPPHIIGDRNVKNYPKSLVLHLWNEL